MGVNNFIDAVSITLKNEGGLEDVVFEPANRGISREFLDGLKAIHYDNKEIQAIEWETITEPQAILVYKLGVWDPTGLSQIDDAPKIQQKVFDAAVNIGRVPAVRMLQNSVMDAGGRPLRVDGILGPVTASAVIAANENELLLHYKVWLIKNYYRICKAWPEKSKYINGWLLRAVQ